MKHKRNFCPNALISEKKKIMISASIQIEPLTKWNFMYKNIFQ